MIVGPTKSSLTPDVKKPWTHSWPRSNHKQAYRSIRLNAADDSDTAQTSTDALSGEQRDGGNSEPGPPARRFASPTFLVQEMVTDDGLALSGSVLRVARSNWVRISPTANSHLIRKHAEQQRSVFRLL